MALLQENLRILISTKKNENLEMAAILSRPQYVTVLNVANIFVVVFLCSSHNQTVLRRTLWYNVSYEYQTPVSLTFFSSNFKFDGKCFAPGISK